MFRPVFYISEVTTSRYWLVIFLCLYLHRSLPKWMVSLLLDETVFCLRIFTIHCRICAQATCTLVVTGQFYGTFSRNFGECADSEYQALFSPSPLNKKREPGIDANCTCASYGLNPALHHYHIFSNHRQCSENHVRSQHNLSQV